MRFRLYFLAFFLLAPALLYAWPAKVVGVSDGDTITVLRDGHDQVKVRLYGIDAPEKAQDFGTRAKQATSDLCFGRVVDVEPVDTDRYGRTVGLVTVDGQSVNRELLAEGMAWVYPQYCRVPACTEWKAVENKARVGKVGLWSQPSPAPPWEWRNGEKAGGKAKTVAAVSTVYHGNRKSGVFHRPGCQHYNCKNCTVEFSSREEAIAAGYRPCGVCKP